MADLIDKIKKIKLVITAVDSILDSVDHICKRKGGNGVFREFAEMIIAAK